MLSKKKRLINKETKENEKQNSNCNKNTLVSFQLNLEFCILKTMYLNRIQFDLPLLNVHAKHKHIPFHQKNVV